MDGGLCGIWELSRCCMWVEKLVSRVEGMWCVIGEGVFVNKI